MNDMLARSLDALGLPHGVMEPEIVRSTLARLRAKTLASCIRPTRKAEVLAAFDKAIELAEVEQ